MLSNYETIIKSGFDIDQILASYNQTQESKKPALSINFQPSEQIVVIKSEKKSDKTSTELVLAEQKDTGSVNFSDIIEMMKFTKFGLFGFFLYFFFCITASLS